MEEKEEEEEGEEVTVDSFGGDPALSGQRYDQFFDITGNSKTSRVQQLLLVATMKEWKIEENCYRREGSA